MAEKNPWKVATVVLVLLFVISFFVPHDVLRPWELSAAAAPVPDSSNDPPVTLVVVNDLDCVVCETAEMETGFKTYFPTLTLRRVNASSPAGKRLITRYNIVMVPALLFDPSVASTANYEKIKLGFESKEDAYLVRSLLLGSGRLLLPPQVLENDTAQGSEDAPVTLFEFSDFECSFCKNFFDNIYPRLKKDYIDTGKVRFIFRHLPLEMHEFATGAALASMCAHEQGKFWEYHDQLYANQHALASENLREYAQKVDLDMVPFADCYNTLKYAKRVGEDVIYAQSLGISGTPAFILNDLFFAGMQPYESFKTLIDAELQKRERMK